MLYYLFSNFNDEKTNQLWLYSWYEISDKNSFNVIHAYDQLQDKAYCDEVIDLVKYLLDNADTVKHHFLENFVSIDCCYMDHDSKDAKLK